MHNAFMIYFANVGNNLAKIWKKFLCIWRRAQKMGSKILSGPQNVQFLSFFSRDAHIAGYTFYAQVLLFYVDIKNQNKNPCAINIFSSKIDIKGGLNSKKCLSGVKIIMQIQISGLYKQPRQHRRKDIFPSIIIFVCIDSKIISNVWAYVGKAQNVWSDLA